MCLAIDAQSRLSTYLIQTAIFWQAEFSATVPRTMHAFVPALSRAGTVLWGLFQIFHNMQTRRGNLQTIAAKEEIYIDPYGSYMAKMATIMCLVKCGR